MPPALMRACLHSGCGEIQAGPYCAAHDRWSDDALGRSNVDIRRWYRTARWATLRLKVLAAEPFCPECEAAGRPVTGTTDVDHRIPHRGNPKLFWDRKNLQALCHGCHSRKTRRGE